MLLPSDANEGGVMRGLQEVSGDVPISILLVLPTRITNIVHRSSTTSRRTPSLLLPMGVRGSPTAQTMGRSR